MKGIATAVIATVLTAGCGHSIKTAADYSHSVRFSDYSTFFFVTGNSSGNPLADERVTAEIEAALTLKGWIPVAQGEGRAVVVVHAATRTNHSYETFYDGWGGWGWRPEGAAGHAEFLQNYQVGTVVVDIFDAETKQVIWRGSATHGFADVLKHRPKATEGAISRMFSKFPPQP